MKKCKIIVISDLHGWKDIGLAGHDNVLRLDARVLGKIEDDEDVHSSFVSGGIDLAARELLKYECESMVGLSVGGVISWRAALAGMKCKKIIAVSATRLRYETMKPSCGLQLIYGEKDAFRPKNEWFEKLDLTFNLVHAKGHEVYKLPNLLDNEI